MLTGFVLSGSRLSAGLSHLGWLAILSGRAETPWWLLAHHPAFSVKVGPQGETLRAPELSCTFTHWHVGGASITHAQWSL